MRKLLLIFVAFILTSLTCFADIMPSSCNTIIHYGIGVLNLPNNFTVYSKPNFQSVVIENVNLNPPQSAIVLDENPADKILIARSNSSHIALATVETDNEDGWFEVVINQKTGQTGWVKMPNLDNFMTWKTFFCTYGKNNGIYMFRDVPEAIKKLHSQDSADSQTLESFTMAKYMIFSMIRGNWMLVTVLDITNSSKIGWIQWRSDDGKLYLFPNLSSQ